MFTIGLIPSCLWYPQLLTYSILPDGHAPYDCEETIVMLEWIGM